MNDVCSEFSLASKHIEKKLIDLRRRIHQHPEVGFSEFKTSEIISKQLRNIGLKVKTVAGTGVVGLLNGKGLRCVALRVEMDAMPIHEKTRLKYVSSVPGIMHACGHDVHIAIAIGVSFVLSKFSNSLKGNVKFIFQPSEEILPGKKSGAKEMVKAGVLSNPVVDAIFGIHCLPELVVGKVEIGVGSVTAETETFRIRILGESSHAAFPHKGKDAILASSELVSSIHHIISRKISPYEPAVINIGMIKGGISESIVPDCVELQGTIRTITRRIHHRIKKLIKSYVSGICKSHNLKYELEFMDYFPSLINDKNLANLAKIVSAKLLGRENVVSNEKTSMAGEDFSVYMSKIPGLYIKLGTGNKKGDKQFPLHNPMFDVDERAIVIGVALLSSVIYEYLKEDV